MHPFDLAAPDRVARLIGVAIIALVVVVAHRIAFAILVRVARRTATRLDDILAARLRRPTLWLAVGVAMAALAPGLDPSPYWAGIWRRAVGLLAPAVIGWVVLALITAYRDVAQARFDITVADNLTARRRRTRISILHRIAVVLLGVVVFCLMLMSIPSVRSIGVTLMASAGLAGLAIGAAAQPALKNLIAGVQMAFTEPIRLDDVVVIEGEWGKIEQIRLTYVVVKAWDERRLVVPVSKFLENSFQNWTRETSQLLGSVLWYVDPAVDVPRLRAKLGEIVTASERWDGRFWNMQVTDIKPEGWVELRGLMTAKDASMSFDLRCEAREALLAYIRDDMPEAAPRTRLAAAREISPAVSPSAHR